MNLVRVFDMDAKTQLLEYSSFRLDDLCLEGNVILVQDHWLYCPATRSREVQLSKHNNTSTQANHTQPFHCHSHTSCVPNITKNAPELGIYSATFYVLKLMQNS